MNFNFTEEEARTPVTFGDMAVLIKEIFDTVAANEEVKNQTILDTVDIITNSVLESEYNRVRDTKFFMCLFSDLTGMSKSGLEEHYTKWCEAFDNLNKEKILHESKTNC